jgi:hypothetical protein
VGGPTNQSYTENKIFESRIGKLNNLVTGQISLPAYLSVDLASLNYLVFAEELTSKKQLAQTTWQKA